MRTSIASVLRSIVATLSVNNLKEYLNKAQGVLPSDSSLKSIIVKEILDKPNLTGVDIRATYQKLKTIIKSYKDREPFQLIVLGPLQGFFNKTDPFNPKKMLDTIRIYKDVLKTPEVELMQSKNLIKDVEKIPFPKVLD
jgi:hypothetical protein